MKLGKDEIQKLVLGGILFGGVVFAYFNILLGPLGMRATRTQTEIDEVRKELTTAKKQIVRTNTLEVDAPAHAVKLKQLTALIPEGSPVAWLPTRLGDLFKQYGVDKAATRLNSEAPEPELTGFRLTSWGVEFQKAEFGQFAHALAGLENEQLLAEVTTLQIETLKEDPGQQHITLTLNHIVKN